MTFLIWQQFFCCFFVFLLFFFVLTPYLGRETPAALIVRQPVFSLSASHPASPALPFEGDHFARCGLTKL